MSNAKFRLVSRSSIAQVHFQGPSVDSLLLLLRRWTASGVDLVGRGLSVTDPPCSFTANVRQFLLEGIATVMIGVACFFIMPDTPALAGRWLNDEERRYFDIQMVIREGGRVNMEKAEKFKWSYL